MVGVRGVFSVRFRLIVFIVFNDFFVLEGCDYYQVAWLKMCDQVFGNWAVILYIKTRIKFGVNVIAIVIVLIFCVGWSFEDVFLRESSIVVCKE